ncbi:MAG: sigma-54-dependent Fis family transcriptional regulator [Anaerolineales bacterium]|nr:sigma-54-dependent Fis family transcriptional regulator [Anaerolineales bacterium]
MTATVLLVEDEAAPRSFMVPVLKGDGYEVREAETLAAAHRALDRGEADIIVLDVELPDGYGPSLLERIRREMPGLPVIVVTGYGNIKMAVEAMKAGARDFIQKPVEIARLRDAVAKAAETVDLMRELNHLRVARNPVEDWVLGETPAMQRIASDLSRVAPTATTVLITGESGTGKEVIAAMLHKHSPRAGKAWVAVNCANFTETLLDSELFGYEAGSFTGATKRKDGLFVTANGSTLFLDEISTMRPELQAKLLRVLEDRSVRRIGGSTEQKVDVRIIAASNRSLPDMVKATTFREDLYHRLNVVEINLPPLRERKDDLPALVGFFIRKYNREMGRSVQGVGPLVMDALRAYDWPGNIRQLRNSVERAMVFCDGDTLEIGHFGPDIMGVFDMPLRASR